MTAARILPEDAEMYAPTFLFGDYEELILTTFLKNRDRVAPNMK